MTHWILGFLLVDIVMTMIFGMSFLIVTFPSYKEPANHKLGYKLLLLGVYSAAHIIVLAYILASR